MPSRAGATRQPFLRQTTRNELGEQAGSLRGLRRGVNAAKALRGSVCFAETCQGNERRRTWPLPVRYAVAARGGRRARPATATPTSANTAPTMMGTVNTSPSNTTPATTPITGAR